MKSLTTNVRVFMLIAVCVGFLAGILFIFQSKTVMGDITTNQGTPDHTFQTYKFFATSTLQRMYATTTSATSTNIIPWSNSRGEIDNGTFVIKGANEVMLYFSRGDSLGTGNSGSSTFRIQVTPDGINWFDYNELGQITISNTADSFYTRVGTSSAMTGTSTLQYILEDNTYYGIRCIVVRATDGESSCTASATF